MIAFINFKNIYPSSLFHCSFNFWLLIQLLILQITPTSHTNSPKHRTNIHTCRYQERLQSQLIKLATIADTQPNGKVRSCSCESAILLYIICFFCLIVYPIIFVSLASYYRCRYFELWLFVACLLFACLYNYSFVVRLVITSIELQFSIIR